MGCHYRGTPSQFAERPHRNRAQDHPDRRSRARRALSAARRPPARRRRSPPGRATERGSSPTRTAAGHVVWGIPSRGGQPAKIGYCRIPAGGSACDVTKEFAFPSAPGQVAQADPLDVTVHAPRPLEVLIFGSCTGCGDGGTRRSRLSAGSRRRAAQLAPRRSPSPRRPAKLGCSTTPTAAGLQPALCGSDDQPRSSRPARATRRSMFAPQGVAANSVTRSAPVRRPQRRASRTVPVAGGAVPQLDLRRRATTTRSSTRSTRAGTLDGLSSATRRSGRRSPRRCRPAVADSAEPQLSSGPTSAYLTYRRIVPGDNQILIRRFNSATDEQDASAPSTQLQGADPIDNSADAPDSVQDVSGRVHVIWTSQHDGGRLRYIQSDVVRRDFSRAGQRRARRDLRRSRRRRRTERRRLGDLEHGRRLADPRRAAGGDLRRPDRHAAAEQAACRHPADAPSR